MKTHPFVLSALLSSCFVNAQQAGHAKTEFHAPMYLGECTKNSGCQTNAKKVVMDANWRWTHTVDGYQNCYTGSSWDKTICPDNDTCARECALDGIDQNDLLNTYGVTADGNSLNLKLVSYGAGGKNVGSRMFMMESDTEYYLFKLKNKEFSFDVDVSNLPCGINGALYFVEMTANGDLGKGNNNAGAKYGTGYCDAQCPQDVKWIGGTANSQDWDSLKGKGPLGSCCAEMDIWEANSMDEAYTLHPCLKNG